MDKTDTGPRMLTRKQAAEYLNVTTAGFDVWVRKGIVPTAIAGTRRWDKRAIDASLDRQSGLSDKDDGEDAFLKWERENALAESKRKAK